MEVNPIRWWEEAALEWLKRQIPARLRQGRGPEGLARAIAPDIASLTLSFNHESESLPADYLQTPRLLSAYLAQFGLLNADRVAYALTQLPPERLAALRARPDAVRILDLGCGTGAAAAGALAALTPADKNGPAPQLVLVDRSKRALDTAADLLAKAPMPPQIVRIRHDLARGFPSGPAFEKPFDLILLTNLVVELGVAPDLLAAWLERLSGLLHPEGALLLVEPATQFAARGLIDVRETQDSLATLAPCPHQEACPLHASNPRDWCHTALPYRRSPWIALLDKLTGLDHTRLVFSYWLASPTPAAPVKTARVVSDELKREGRYVRLFCTPAATLDARPAGEYAPYARGETFMDAAPGPVARKAAPRPPAQPKS